jgi:hypothetical protein
MTLDRSLPRATPGASPGDATYRPAPPPSRPAAGLIGPLAAPRRR